MSLRTKIRYITTSVSAIALNAVENKISDHNKYITTPEFNKLTAQNFASRLA